MVNVRTKYGFEHNQDLLTAMVYPAKKQAGALKIVDHAVVLWLTKNDELIIIDPQVFYQENNIILYSSNESERYLDEDSSLILRPIKDYVKGNVDILDPERETNVLESLHIESKSTGDDVNLSKTNKKLKELIDRLRQYEAKVENKPSESFNLRGPNPRGPVGL
jgi:chorismate mutase